MVIEAVTTLVPEHCHARLASGGAATQLKTIQGHRLHRRAVPRQAADPNVE